MAVTFKLQSAGDYLKTQASGPPVGRPKGLNRRRRSTAASARSNSVNMCPEQTVRLLRAWLGLSAPPPRAAAAATARRHLSAVNSNYRPARRDRAVNLRKWRLFTVCVNSAESATGRTRPTAR